MRPDQRKNEEPARFQSFSFRTFAPMKILLVCHGNICRSPMAEGLLRDMAKARHLSVVTDSAGTSDEHAGEPPHRLAQATMLRHDHDISGLRSRQLDAEDFTHFDLLLAMDDANLRNMRKLAPGAELARKARAVMDFARHHKEREVPDPYWGGAADYEHVYDLLTDALKGVLDHVEGKQ